MPYTTSSEVTADFKNLVITAAAAPKPSNVTSEDIDQFIKEADAMINSYVGQRYVLPVDPLAEGFQLLKLYSRALVTERVRSILEVKQISNTGANQAPRRLLSVNDVLKELNKITERLVDLIGATELNPGQNFAASNYDNNVQPVMKKSERQW